MWDTYRANYGCAWIPYNPSELYSNGYNSCESDTIPPHIVSTTASSDTSVKVGFSEGLNRLSAEDIGNYAINNGVSIISASLAADLSAVTLTTTSHTEGLTYTLTITNVEDLAGNQIPVTTVDYQYSSLVGYWRLDDESGNTASDSSSNSNNGTLVNNPTWTSGQVNGALRFDGGNDYVEAPDDPSFDIAEQITITAWINPADVSHWRTIVSKFAHTPNRRKDLYWFLYAGNIGIGLAGPLGAEENWIPSVPIETGVWTHVALTYDGSTIRMFKNGVNAASTSESGVLMLADASSSESFYIGRNTEWGEYFNGIIDDVRLYNRFLTAAEVQAIYNEHAGTPTTYTLSITAVNGSVSKSPDKTSYNAGETVTLQATANTGYHFTGWSGDASGTTNPVSITMNSNKSVTAGFTINTYTLNVTATNGSVTKTPNKSTYNYGETVSLLATPNTGYYFTGWSGDASGMTNPVSITMNSNKSVTAGFAANDTYTLNITATNGSVTKTPDKASYDYGETVSLLAVPSSGYHFTSWSGDASGTTNPVSITMNSNKSVTAGFAINTYTLNVTAANGSVTKTPNKSTYNHGEAVSLLATANTGYHFTSWSGDASGTTNPVSITMNSNKSVTAGFAINTYTLNVTATNGSVTKMPNKSTYNHGETVSLLAVPNSGYHFTNWSGDASGTTNPVSITMNSNKSVTAGFAENPSDVGAPAVTNCSPQADDIQVPLNNLVVLHLVDDDPGVDAGSVTITADDGVIYAGDKSSYQSTSGICRRIGSENDYAFIYQSDEFFDFDQTIELSVSARDSAGNQMAPYWYRFQTQMWSFGSNKNVAAGTGNPYKEVTATACDSAGNVWVVWQEGQPGSRDICAAKLVDGAAAFTNVVKLTNDNFEQCNADITVGAANKLYVVWQANNRGNWDIYLSTSTGGTSWSAPKLITDSSYNQTNPVIAVDAAVLAKAYIVWEDDRNGNSDIYAASSNNGFITSTVWAITSEQSRQSEPAIAVGADNTVYVVWTDEREGSKDIYGAASNSGPWTNVPVVSDAGNIYHQSSPAIEVEDTGSRLHLLWVDNSGGDYDIYYAQTSGGMPASPLAGESIIDDTTGSDQLSPTIAVSGTTNSGLDVFACWQDERNNDTDLYFVPVGSGNGTNVFVGDNSTNSNQTMPVMGLDKRGYPYVVWTDDRNGNPNIYYAASTYADPQILAQKQVSAGSATVVGVDPIAVGKLDDISVSIPAGACQYGARVTISKVRNTPEFPQCTPITGYDIGPSGMDFASPVTVIIPYDATQYPDSISPYCYTPQEQNPSQDGITGIEELVISSTIHAMRFQTTHFSQFFLGTGAVAEEPNVIWRFGTFGGQINTKLVMTDAANNQVEIWLIGSGYGEIVEGQGLSQIVLYNTTASSLLMITPKGIGVQGTIGDIIVNGSLSSITARSINLVGDITVTGTVGIVALNNVSGSHISVGAPSNSYSTTTFQLGRVTNLSIVSQTPISNLTVKEWLDTDSTIDEIKAPSIGTLSSSGDIINKIAGDFCADLTLTGGTSAYTLLTASIAGSLLDCDWNITGDLLSLSIRGAAQNSRICSTGMISSIMLGASHDSDFLAGFDPDFDARRPYGSSDFSSTNAPIRMFMILGITTKPGTYYFSNTNVSAPTIGTVLLVNPQTQNSGESFGFWALDTSAASDLTMVSSRSTIDANGTFSLRQGYGIPGNVNDLWMQIFTP
jgi:uncharacterized repeat protein (TIGR02543 family)